MSHHGLHHVTAIAGEPRANLDFYTAVLGLRFVKKTVNFDDPGTYHLYYGDTAGSPGTILTFFPWAGAARGRSGLGQAIETSFAIPTESIGFWTHRLVEKGVRHGAPERRFGETVLPFEDPHGTALALVGREAPAGAPWTGGGIPAEAAIRGFDGVTLLLADPEPTGAILSDVLGFADTGRDEGRIRFETGADRIGGRVDLRAAPGFLAGIQGAGSVHHVAFRAADDAEQAAMGKRLRDNHRIAVTPQRDRQYFRSTYFREPGGVLFEIATDAPGFAIDEAPDALGGALMLPPMHEPRRAEIEAVLPEL